jgi:hypothetical protein
MSHAASLFDLQFKYCDVISAAQAMEAIGGLRRAA